jgi:hypothetical protein
MASVLTSVHHISQLTTSTNAAYPNAATHLVILTRLMFLLSHLLSLPPMTAFFFLIQNPNSSCVQISALVSESARYAMLLHVVTPWRGLPTHHQPLTSPIDFLTQSTAVSSRLYLWHLASLGLHYRRSLRSQHAGTKLIREPFSGHDSRDANRDLG